MKTHRDLVTLGAYQRGRDASIDAAIDAPGSVSVDAPIDMLIDAPLPPSAHHHMFFGWSALGLVVYFAYGHRHSHLARK